MGMIGIDLNQPIQFGWASLRYFRRNEKHVTRLCHEKVLLLVYDGVLRFTEDGVDYEVHPGEYHIQKENSIQEGKVASDIPKYLYVHFYATWSSEKDALPFRGHFDYHILKPSIEQLDYMAHNNGSQLDMTILFLSILSSLSRNTAAGKSLANRIAAYLNIEFTKTISLEMLCDEFHYSKNHIINQFKAEYNMTPIAYIDELRLNKAMHLMEMTSAPIESIIRESGFATYTHFFRLFRRKTGLSPTEWRKKIRVQPAGVI